MLRFPSFVRSFNISILVFIGFVQSAMAAMPDNLTEIAQNSIVYIYFEAEGQSNPGSDFTVGTGFIVSKEGHILTASHVFEKWRRLPPQERASLIPMATLFDKPSNTVSKRYRLQILDIGDDSDEGDDIALLKASNLTESFSTAPICLSRSDPSVTTGQPIFSFGFPLNNFFQPVPGTLGTRKADNNRRWYASIPFTFGMSGGPVYSARGFVMGLVKGGISGTEAVRFITPIDKARSLLSRTTFQEKCDASGEPLLGSWEGSYSCGRERGLAVITISRDASGKLVGSEQFSRGVFGGSVRHEINKTAENTYVFNSRFMGFPSFEYQLRVRYDPSSETLQGVYVGHPNCQTITFRRK